MLLSPREWAQQEFGGCQLGDRRRTKRLMRIGAQLAASPGGTLPQAFPDWAELKGAYRFWGQSGVSFESVIAAPAERTRQQCRRAGEYLLIEDTTLLDYSGHGSVAGLGVIGNGGGHGFELHTTLAVRIEFWTAEQQPEGAVIGLFHQQCRTPRPAPAGESKAQRLSRPRKSQVWAGALKWGGRPPEATRWIYVADRESDFYEPLELCQAHGVDFVIRSGCDRRLADKVSHLRAGLKESPLLGQTTVPLRARAGQPARTAIVELRGVRLDLDGPWRPSGQKAPLRNVGAVEVREVDAPEGIKEPLHWILLTSLDCATKAQVQRVVGIYTRRWWIEEYHKALKTGAGVEKSQLEQAHRLEPLIAVLAVVAVRLLNAKLLARSRPESFEAATSLGPQIVAILEKKFGKPKRGWTNANVITGVARVGGFLARRHDGMPGWQTIWRGWQRLLWMCDGAETLNQP